MKKAKNDPGFQVGDKIRFFLTWTDENGKRQTYQEFKVDLILTKINSRFFYAEGRKGTCTMESKTSWDCTITRMEDGTWSVTQDLGILKTTSK